MKNTDTYDQIINACDHHIIYDRYYVCDKCGLVLDQYTHFEYFNRNEDRIPIETYRRGRRPLILSLSNDVIKRRNIYNTIRDLTIDLDLSQLIINDIINVAKKIEFKSRYELELQYIIYLSCLRFKRYINIHDIINGEIDMRRLTHYKNTYYSDINHRDECVFCINDILTQINHIELLSECIRILDLNYIYIKHLRSNQVAKNIIYQLAKRIGIKNLYKLIGNGIVKCRLRFN